MKRIFGILSLLCVSTVALSAASTEDQASFRERFIERARMAERLRDAKPTDKALFDLANDQRRAMLKEPVEQQLAAIDHSIRQEDKLEVAGALYTYQSLVAYKHAVPRVVPDPRYKTLLLERLAKDDFSSWVYTGSLRGALHMYPSRETMLAYMHAAQRAPDPETREEFITMTTALLDIHLQYAVNDPTEKKLRTLAEFEKWFEKNKDRIRFDKEGNAHYGGGPGEFKPPKLSAEDKARIKKDPACLLRLFDSIQGSEDENPQQALDLNARCGQALLGKEGSAAVAKALEETKDGSPPSLDLQFALSSAAVSYPTTSAVLVAVAAVASDGSASAELREIAKQIVEDFGEDLDEVLKGEPSSVKKRVRELLEEPEK